VIVDFQNRFIVPGFGRHRFPKGVVRNVPEALRNHLPLRAKILPDNYAADEELRAQDENLRAQDFARMQEESTAEKALEQAGMSGFAEEFDEVEPADEDALVDFWFGGKEYKTEAAMKAARTRSEKGPLA
jgi:hypothetical protein